MVVLLKYNTMRGVKMNILAVDFKRKKLVNSISNGDFFPGPMTVGPSKKELRLKEKAIEQFVQDMKEGLTLKQYIKVLEGIVSIQHYKKIKDKQLAAICLEYGSF